MRSFDPLENASPELLAAVDAIGGEELLSAIDELVHANEEYTVGWYDGKWADSTADEVLDWSIARLAATGPTIAHAALHVALRTFPVDEDDETVGDATIVTAFIRVVLNPQIRVDRYELDFSDLGEWIKHDAIRFVDGLTPDVRNKQP